MITSARTAYRLARPCTRPSTRLGLCKQQQHRCVGAQANPRAGDTDGPQPMSMFGDARIALGSLVADVLDEMPSQPRYFLDNGTLLGLWRDGALIESDDDFDFAVLVDGKDFSTRWVVAFQQEFQRRLDARCKHSGGTYHSRVVDTYAHKIEVYDPALGSFPLSGEQYNGARYHHVSVDLQMHVEELAPAALAVELHQAGVEAAADGMEEFVGAPFADDASAGAHHIGDATTINASSPIPRAMLVREVSMGKPVLIADGGILVTDKGVTIKHADFITRGQAPSSAFEPLGSVTFAGRVWPVPGKQKMYLSYLYGYLGLGAEFCVHSKLYRKKLIPGVGGRGTVSCGDGNDGNNNDDGGDNDTVNPLRLYTDMCADLFHTGHVNYLRQCSAIADNVHLIVGIHSDATIESYKRSSICTMEERVGVVEACRYVNQVLPNAPLRVTEEFMDLHDIDFVIHGTETPEAERQAMYDLPIVRGQYTEVPRTEGISTTELIDRIASRLAVDYEEHALPSDRQPVVAVIRDALLK